ncbi:hypothetical protein [Paenibacillus piscarius]|uniref:hypothetical protein n=1 Tax=Paenibacillus piscarius TaxID=1089681 RepID=UPI001EE88903|nr:hypothetical protein [Paenibacillus piscarius]
MDYLDQVDLAVFYSMDKKERTFRDKSVPEIQRDFFLRDMPVNGYLSNSPRGNLPSNKTLVLFHFDRQVIASAIFIKQLTIDDSEYQYASYFIPDSIMVYTETIVIEELRKVSSKIVNFQSFMPHTKRNLYLY